MKAVWSMVRCQNCHLICALQCFGTHSASNAKIIYKKCFTEQKPHVTVLHVDGEYAGMPYLYYAFEMVIYNQAENEQRTVSSCKNWKIWKLRRMTTSNTALEDFTLSIIVHLTDIKLFCRL